MFAEALRQAQAAAAEARHEEVLVACERAVRAIAAASPNEQSEIYFLRADSLRHLGRWTEAAEAFLRVCSICVDPTTRARASRALRLLSEILRRSRDFDGAATYAERAADGAVALNDLAGALFSRVPLARIESDRGHIDEAEQILSEVLAVAEERLPAGSPELALIVVAARTVQSLLHFRRHDIPEAMACLVAVRDDAANVPHAITTAAFHRQIAILHEVERSYSAAVRHLNHALSLYDRVRFEPGRYDVYWSLALSYTDLGDLRTARLCLEQCASIAERLDLRLELGKSKSSFAELAVREGEYEQAISLFREDLAISSSLGDEQALGHCHRKLAICNLLMGAMADAENHARASIAHFVSMSRSSEADQVRVLLSRILVQAGRVDEAGELVAEVRGRPARGNGLGGPLRAEAMVRRARGDLPGAVRCYHESLTAQDHSQPSRDLASTYLEAGLAHRELDDPEGAKEHLRAAVDTAGMLGSRDLWQQAVDELWQLDIMEAQRLMLKPYLPGSAVEELRGGEATGRLQVATVMFVDMRGATALSGTLSPLELAEVVSAFLGPVVRIILRWGGTVDKFIGDCVMAVFGLGTGDGAEEATRAGLEIIEYMEATKEIRRRSGASVLEATIGVNTGEVVAGCFGPLLRRDYTVLGYHVNLAQRLQSIAGSVEHERGTRMVISDATRNCLTTPLPLSPVDLRTLTLKGIDTAGLSAWLVEAEAAIGGPT